MHNLALLLARLLLAFIFVMAGLNKIGGYGDTLAYMSQFGVPGVLLPLVILLELVGGLAIAVGAFTRYLSVAFAGFCILSALIFHTNFAEQTQMVMFMKNLAIAGGFLALLVAGPGDWSVDDRIGKTRDPSAT